MPLVINPYRSPWAQAAGDDSLLSETADAPFNWDDHFGSADERDWYSQVQDNDLGSFECVEDEQPNKSDLSATARTSGASREVSWLQGRPAEEDAVQQVSAAENKRRRLNLAKQPWESKPSHLNQSFDFFFEGMPSVGVREALTVALEVEPGTRRRPDPLDCDQETGKGPDPKVRRRHSR